MKTILIIIFLFQFQVVYGQKLTGTIIDSISNMPVGYASVGLIKFNKGTTADADGHFVINYPLNLPSDTMVVSCVGYRTVKLPLEKVKILRKVFLTRNAPLLKEVVIRHYSRKTTLPWNEGKSNNLLYTSSGNSHTQAARLLQSPTKFSQLESVTIATGGTGLFSKQTESLFRIRIYDYDSIRNKPGVELCDSIIEVSGKGIVTVKLDKYQITLPNKQFFIAVQWLLIKENIEGRSTFALSDSDYYYRPGIRMVHLPDKGNSWWLHHNQNWSRWEYDLSLTATVLY